MTLKDWKSAGETGDRSLTILSAARARRGLCLVTVLLPGLLLSAPVRADMFAGIRAGAMTVDVASRKDPRNLAAYLGIQLNSRLADISLAGEVNRSVSKGETRAGDDLEFEAEAVYLRVRTTSSLFVSLRGGYVRDRVITGRDSQHGEGLLLGGAVGLVSGRVRIAIEYTSIAGDANFLSLGLEF